MCHRAKFRRRPVKIAKIWQFFDFSKLRLSTILDLLYILLVIPKRSFLNKWRKKTDSNRLIQVHQENGWWNRGMICSTQYPLCHQHAWATNQSHSFTFQYSYDNSSKFNWCTAGWANSLPLSIASIRASVSLLRIQSISCRCERSPALSSRRRPAMWPDGPPAGIAPDLGRALRPSNSSTSSRSTSLVVSSTHLHNQPHNIIHQSLLSPTPKFA